MDALNVLVHAVGWTLIHSLWIGALAAGIYALGATRLRNQAPQSAYVLGLICLFALVVALLATFVHELDQAQVSADERAIASAYAALPTESAVRSQAPQATATGSLARLIESVLPALVLLWGVAVLTIGSGVARTQVALKRLVNAGVNLPDLAAPVIDLARAFGVNRSVAVVSSACARVPFVIGHFAPVIVLPMTIAAGMPWPQLRLILAHEIAHLRRADYLVNWLQLALEVLLFFHPAVRWLSEELRSLREACCDDLVVAFAGGRADYTRALLSLEEFRHEAPLLAPSAVAGGLLWRVQRMAGRAPSHAGALQKLLLPAVILGLLVSLIGGGAQLRPGALARDFVLPRVSLLRTEPAPSLPSLPAPVWKAQWANAPIPALVASAPARLPAVALPALSQPVPVAALPVQHLPLEVMATRLGSSSAPAPAGPAANLSVRVPAITPISALAPEYPRGQGLADDELRIELSFRLDAQGRVIDIQAPPMSARAQPFVESARTALARWRYGPNAATQLGDARLQHRFLFRDGTTTSGPGDCTLMAGTPRICVVNPLARRAQATVPGGRCESTTGSRLCRR